MTAAGGERGAAMGAALRALDEQLVQAPVDDQFILVLRACAAGGHRALADLCDRIAKPSKEYPLDELPVLALLEAVGHEERAARAVRAAAWVMAAQRMTETWSSTWFDVMVVAREAMPIPAGEWERVRPLALLTANALLDDDPSEREGMHFQFHRESLEIIIEAATGKRPLRKDMLQVIAHWTACFRAGIAACDEHLRALA